MIKKTDRKDAPLSMQLINLLDLVNNTYLPTVYILRNQNQSCQSCHTTPFYHSKSESKVLVIF
jgi:hypothetical protein